MSFNFVCPFCRKELLGEEEWIGKEVTCPSCSRPIRVERPVPPPMQPMVAMKGQCPYCKGYYDMRPEWRGQVSQCPHCRASIVVQEAAPPPVPPASQKPPLATFLFVWGIILLVFNFAENIASNCLIKFCRNNLTPYFRATPWVYFGLGLVGVLLSIIYFACKPKTARRFDTAYIGIVLSWSWVFWRICYVILDLCFKR